MGLRLLQDQNNLKRPMIQIIGAGYEGNLAKPMLSGCVLVTDITQGRIADNKKPAEAGFSSGPFNSLSK